MPMPTIRNVLLAVPPTGLYIREDRCQTPIEHMATVALRPPIDLMYAASAFEQGGAVCRLVDYPAEQQDLARLLADLKEFNSDLALLSITTPGLDEDMAAAAEMKKAAPRLIVAAKGAHFNTLDEDALKKYPQLDLVFRGEFEPACREIAEGKPLDEIQGITFRASLLSPERPPAEIIRTPARPFIEELDTLPFPARHLAHNELYLRPDTGAMQTTIVTNRGCPYGCNYCLSTQVAGRKNRARSVANIIAEIEECVNRHGIRSFLFRSDLFTAKRTWVLELCAEIRKRGLKIDWSCNSRVDTLDAELLAEMKKAGCWIIAFGIESGDEEILKKIGKKANLDTARKTLKITRQSGILSSIYFLMGLPWDTRETLKANERFARELQPDVLEIFYVYPFPGTPLYDEAVKLGLLPAGSIPKSAYDRPCMPTLALSMEELSGARAHALKNYYLQPRVILRTLLRARSPRVFWNYVRLGLRQLKEFI